MKRFTRILYRLLLSVSLWVVSYLLVRTLMELPMPFARRSAVLPLGLGFGTGLVVFSLVCRFAPAYVLGHELTHWLAAKLFWRRTGPLRVGSGSGSVQVENPNIWIALAPYFVPFYTVVWIGLYGFAMLVTDASLSDLGHSIVYGGVGLTYAFHVVMTLHALRHGQSDLHAHGVLLSLSLILCANLAVLLLAMVLAGCHWTTAWKLICSHARPILGALAHAVRAALR